MSALTSPDATRQFSSAWTRRERAASPSSCPAPASHDAQTLSSGSKRVPWSAGSTSARPTHSPASPASRSASSSAGASRRRSSSKARAGAAPATEAPARASTRPVMPVKPSSEKAARTVSGSNVGNLALARSHSMGASVRMMATLRESRASSMWARRFSPILPLTSSAWAMTSSSEPYWQMRALAFLGPMPGTPGMLSEVSPLRP